MSDEFDSMADDCITIGFEVLGEPGERDFRDYWEFARRFELPGLMGAVAVAFHASKVMGRDIDVGECGDEMINYVVGTLL